MQASRQIAAFAAAPHVLTDAVRHAGRRALLNMTGCAIGGSNAEAIDHLVALLPGVSGPAKARVIGRQVQTDPLWAAYINAGAANIFDFDDTHIPTVIHPAAPVAPAVLALCESLAAEGQPVSGARMIEAIVIGMEVTCRLGLALHPVHYARGWHITSTCGTFGAALACGRILGLSETQLNDALGHALAQNAGSVETLGTMSKSLSVGQAARGGLMAALLAQRGFTGPEAPLEGIRGFLALHSDKPDYAALCDDLGGRWEVLNNTFKPYPCGVVLNPVIEACLGLAAEGIEPATITAVTLTGHPLLRQRTDRPAPASGRLSQVSAQHAVAVSLLRGRAGQAEFSDSEVIAPEVLALGAKLRFVDDPARSIEGVEIRLTLTGGEIVTREIKAARGGLDHPLSDADLAGKLRSQISWRGLSLDAAALINALETIEDAGNGAAFLSLTQG